MNRPTQALFALLALALAATLVACGRGEQHAAPADARASTPVRTTAVESAAVSDRVRAIGILAPRDEVRLSFKVGGIVESIGVEAGDRVRRGQLLATLKSAEVDAGVRQAGEALEKSRRDLERGRRLRVDEVATEEQVQDLETVYNVARANAAAVRFNAQFARIVAPADGLVMQRYAEADELVQAGQPIIVVGATGSGWVVRASLADRDVVRIATGDSARIELDAFPGRSFEGRIARIGSAADPQTGTFEIEIAVEPQGARFVRGLVARTELALQDASTTDARTIVPIAALVDANGAQATVFVFDRAQGTVRRQQIEIGPLVGDRVIVVAGLAAGEQVVTAGAAWLVDGKSVRVVDDRG